MWSPMVVSTQVVGQRPPPLWVRKWIWNLCVWPSNILLIGGDGARDVNQGKGCLLVQSWSWMIPTHKQYHHSHPLAYNLQHIRMLQWVNGKTISKMCREATCRPQSNDHATRRKPKQPKICKIMASKNEFCAQNTRTCPRWPRTAMG